MYFRTLYKLQQEEPEHILDGAAAGDFHTVQESVARSVARRYSFQGARWDLLSKVLACRLPKQRVMRHGFHARQPLCGQQSNSEWQWRHCGELYILLYRHNRDGMDGWTLGELLATSLHLSVPLRSRCVSYEQHGWVERGLKAVMQGRLHVYAATWLHQHIQYY
jgi:hypothetical protein